MRDIFIACTMLSIPAAVVLVLGRTASSMFFEPEAAVAETPAPAADHVAARHAFVAQCAACHGADLGGTGQGPSLVHADYAPDLRSDAEFRRAIVLGQPERLWDYGDMPANPDLDDATVAALVALIRAAQAAQGLGG